MTERRHVDRPWLRPRPQVSAPMARWWRSTSAQMARRCRSCSGRAWRASSCPQNPMKKDHENKSCSIIVLIDVLSQLPCAPCNPQLLLDCANRMPPPGAPPGVSPRVFLRSEKKDPSDRKEEEEEEEEKLGIESRGWEVCIGPCCCAPPFSVCNCSCRAAEYSRNAERGRFGACGPLCKGRRKRSHFVCRQHRGNVKSQRYIRHSRMRAACMEFGE